ncbi:MAG TPA: YtxH domain-containing protein [Thermomicrobiales bacterium]|nr:YtxH domain-containing protein [Thermomicrobiales bacterium]
MQGLVKFLVGGAAGTAVGLVVGSLLAPQRGDEFQAEARRRMDAARRAGDEAERETEAVLRERFRQRVSDPTALTPSTVNGQQG